MGVVFPRQVVLSSIRKIHKDELVSKLATSISPWFLLQLPALMDCDLEVQDGATLSTRVDYSQSVFITATGRK